MKRIETPLAGALVFEIGRYEDDRGWLSEVWNRRRYAEHGLDVEFQQENVSFSRGGVLRGLHFQSPNPQGKLITVLEGEVWDVGVDIRAGSPTYAQWFGVTLSGENGRQFWLPEGFAHGFLVLSERALVHYSCTVPHEAGNDRAVAWNDPEIGIRWPVEPRTISDRDRRAPRLSELTLPAG